MQDKLVRLLEYFELKARVFQIGLLANPASFCAEDGFGYVHLLRSGKLRLEYGKQEALLLDEATIFFYMNPTNHRLIPMDDSVDMICASFEFGAGLNNPLVRALPELTLLKQKNVPSLSASLDLLFREAKENHSGRQAILDRQIEVILILLLRELMNEDRIKIGLLAGLADSRLAKAINAMHAQPERNWSLTDLAEQAGMSRARFANHFRDKVGSTPIHYLTEWRMSLAQSMLSRGQSVQIVADKTGYSSASALSRVFLAHTGLSPSNWKKMNVKEQ